MEELYHVLNRGVDKRTIFLDKQDHLRFVHDLFEFNDQERVNCTWYRFHKINDIASRNIIKPEKRKPRKLLVDIHAFCLMHNHYHLLLTPRVDLGITKFMRKLDIGYAKYFNEKYKRKGTLFEGRYKSIVIKEEAHFVHLPYYIHANPLDAFEPEWRKKAISDARRATEFLESYRWSSHLDYLGIKNFPSVTRRDFLLKFFGGEQEYRRAFQAWLTSLEVEQLEPVALE